MSERLCSGFGDSCFSGLPSDIFPKVANALTLVWLWRTEGTEIGGHLADELLIDAAENDDVLVLLVLGNVDTHGNIERDRM